MINELAYAKVNLALEVNETNKDNYHLVRNVMVPIDLYDSISVEKIDSNILLIDNSNIEVESNLVYKAAKLFIDTYKIKSGVLINLEKHIPSEAGLAGGSSDAAATLRALNRLFETNKTLDELATLGAKLGADVPYCVYQRASLCTNLGEKVELLITNYPKWNILLVKPPFGCSTKEIYSHYVKKNHDIDKVEKVIEALQEADLEKLNKYKFNDLEETAINLNSKLLKVKLSFGVESFCMMSGSGSTFFEISQDLDYLKNKQKQLSLYYNTYLTKLL